MIFEWWVILWLYICGVVFFYGESRMVERMGHFKWDWLTVILVCVTWPVMVTVAAILEAFKCVSWRRS